MTPSPIEQTLLHQFRQLPQALQQLVIQFINLLLAERSQVTPLLSRPEPSPSVFELAGSLIGSAEGPSDLSTNPDYLEGMGRE
ncbi:hypothetical protein AMR42_06835 [Limnothrix sp. PR1529]|uniref:hypothetical protein n=1 Tax=Limnothrix sp. PR1529 TaxID=1704291 RepID=UPI00081E75F7|nr:hypothetical protein [Limnothrix sp. PR1529]OCQ90773.1 hypothetical protein BCR12_03485 [Limnothrix sp. P13C2]PIB14282.1 hypothetical protein AMR42_06835 [Limnothrix sp. PR1529]